MKLAIISCLPLLVAAQSFEQYIEFEQYHNVAKSNATYNARDIRGYNTTASFDPDKRFDWNLLVDIRDGLPSSIVNGTDDEELMATWFQAWPEEVLDGGARIDGENTWTVCMSAVRINQRLDDKPVNDFEEDCSGLLSDKCTKALKEFAADDRLCLDREENDDILDVPDGCTAAYFRYPLSLTKRAAWRNGTGLEDHPVGFVWPQLRGKDNFAPYDEAIDSTYIVMIGWGPANETNDSTGFVDPGAPRLESALRCLRMEVQGDSRSLDGAMAFGVDMGRNAVVIASLAALLLGMNLL